MDVPIEVQKMIVEGNVFENVGNYAAAEAAYLEVMQRFGDREPVFRGMLYINLGTNAQHDDRLDEAATFFRQSIKLLENERGEAHLQCAHAHYNLANQLLGEDDPAAPAHAAEATKRLHANPFASPVDRADAAMLSFLASLFIANVADEHSFTATWEEISAIDADGLAPLLVETFVVNWLSFNRQAHPERFPAVQREVRDWLGEMMMGDALAQLLADG